MAYAATVTIKRATRSGRRAFIITVAETGASATDEWNTSGGTGITVTGPISGGQTFPPPTTWTTLQYTVVKASGAAATVAPVLAKATGAISAGSADYLTGYAAATYIDDQTRVSRSVPAGTLYGRSNPASGSDNAINTTIVLMEGTI